MTLLPGQTLTNGVSNFIFGSNLGQAINPQTVFNNATIQASVAAARVTVMRTSFKPTATHADMDSHYNAIIACGCVPLITLNMLSSLAQNSDLVTYMGSKCLLYEVGNEPDGAAGGGPFTAARYYTYWSTNVPTLRGLNASAAFIGPTVTHAGIVGGPAGSRGAYISDWLISCQSAGGSMLPDAISFHDYPCNGLVNNAANQLVCSSRATRFADDYAAVDSIVKGILGASLPLCLTEWNVPGLSWGLNATYVTPWVHAALDSMVNAGYAMANQFEAGTGEDGGLGTLDLVTAIAPFPPGLDYQPMVDKINQYLHAQPAVGYPGAVLADSPLYYNRGGTADSGSLNHVGTIVGGVTTGQTGLIAGDTQTCDLFDGSTGYITASDVGLPSGASAWSQELLVKPTASNNNATSFIWGTNATNQASLQRFKSSGDFISSGGWTNAFQQDSTTIQVVGVIYYLLATYDGANLLFYVGDTSTGILSVYGPKPLTFNLTLAGTLYIGTDSSLISGHFYQGYAQERAIYGAALSSIRAAAHWQAFIQSTKPVYSSFGAHA